MNFEEIKSEIISLAKQHDAIDEQTLNDFKDAETIEHDVVKLISGYCEQNGYLVNGFPTYKRNIIDEEEEDDYFSTQRYELYLYTLALHKDDVFELLWLYNISFWPDMADNKNDFMEHVKWSVLNGYEVKL